MVMTTTMMPVAAIAVSPAVATGSSVREKVAMTAMMTPPMAAPTAVRPVAVMVMFSPVNSAMMATQSTPMRAYPVVRQLGVGMASSKRASRAVMTATWPPAMPAPPPASQPAAAMG